MYVIPVYRQGTHKRQEREEPTCVILIRCRLGTVDFSCEPLLNAVFAAASQR